MNDNANSILASTFANSLIACVKWDVICGLSRLLCDPTTRIQLLIKQRFVAVLARRQRLEESVNLDRTTRAFVLPSVQQDYLQTHFTSDTISHSSVQPEIRLLGEFTAIGRFSLHQPTELKLTVLCESSKIRTFDIKKDHRIEIRADFRKYSHWNKIGTLQNIRMLCSYVKNRCFQYI